MSGKMMAHKVSLTDRVGGNKFVLRTASGYSVTFSREDPEVLYHDLVLGSAECAQLEAEGYDVSPGSGAYASKPKKPRKKKAKTEEEFELPDVEVATEENES